jgi:hypothetical protein
MKLAAGRIEGTLRFFRAVVDQRAAIFMDAIAKKPFYGGFLPGPRNPWVGGGPCGLLMAPQLIRKLPCFQWIPRCSEHVKSLA